jgi:hypothetical protein
METTQPNPRRNFLLVAGLCGAGAAVVAATARIPSEAAAVVPVPAEEKSGYRASPHILTYYKTTEF